MNATLPTVLPPDAAGWWSWLRQELAPTRGRKETTIRLTLIVALITVISMTLQVPEAALSAYMAFFITKENRVLTALTGILATIGAILAFGASFLVYRATYDFPQMRIPAIALSLFAGMFLARILTLGPLAFIIGFAFAASQTIAELNPDPDILVRNLLWLWVAIVYPIALTVVLSQWVLPVHPEKTPPRPKHGFFVPDAFRNPAHVRFALKVTLAAMTCYILYTAVDWAGIHTAFITCCIIALESTGATVRKARLRLIGCLIGALLGFLSIVFLIPRMESIVSLVLLTSAVGALAGWIAAGSERTSYVGLQIALAFFMCVFQGFAPDTGFETIRDRIVGIVLGIVVSSFVFRHVWPETSVTRFRTAISRASRSLSELVAIPEVGSMPDAQRIDALRQSIAQCLAEAGRYAELAAFEPDDVRRSFPIERWMNELRALTMAASALVEPGQLESWSVLGHDAQQADSAARHHLATELQAIADLLDVATSSRPTTTPSFPPSPANERTDAITRLGEQVGRLRLLLP